MTRPGTRFKGWGMPTFKTVSIERKGKTYNGSYLIDLGMLNVSSAYGSKEVKLAKRKEADAIAKTLLTELVEAWRP